MPAMTAPDCFRSGTLAGPSGGSNQRLTRSPPLDARCRNRRRGDPQRERGSLLPLAEAALPLRGGPGGAVPLLPPLREHGRPARAGCLRRDGAARELAAPPALLLRAG